ncbi:MAG: hypothetical protein Kow0062_06300 [Acidobacteriota bacterium]|nr:MAG: hypothetical protein D6738_09575 [Acidobacteriota bacterium]
MLREPLDENLLDELTRLVGRPAVVVREALARLMTVLNGSVDPELGRRLGAFPMTAWQAIDSGSPVVRAIWSAVVGAGMTTEEAFTALAVVDDHVRRRYGADAWSRVAEWGPRLAGRYCPGDAAPAPFGRPASA